VLSFEIIILLWTVDGTRNLVKSKTGQTWILTTSSVTEVCASTGYLVVSARFNPLHLASFGRPPFVQTSLDGHFVSVVYQGQCNIFEARLSRVRMVSLSLSIQRQRSTSKVSCARVLICKVFAHPFRLGGVTVAIIAVYFIVSYRSGDNC